MYKLPQQQWRVTNKSKPQKMWTAFCLSLLSLLTLSLSSCGQTTLQHKPDSCDNPDAAISCCFVNRPATLTNSMRITQPDDEGEKLTIWGTIFKADGVTPYPDLILYVYHTDSKGYYSKSGNEKGFQKWHGRHHGWCKTDSRGYYEIHTIRPARYPNNTMPAHIHAAVKTNKGDMFWISDFVFKDDSLVNDKYLASLTTTGGTGVVDIKKNGPDSWNGRRDIFLK